MFVTAFVIISFRVIEFLLRFNPGPVEPPLFAGLAYVVWMAPQRLRCLPDRRVSCSRIVTGVLMLVW